MAGTLGTDTRGNTVTKTDEQKKILALMLGAMQLFVSGGGTGVNSQHVQGAAADGATAVGNPAQVGGVAEQGSTYAPGYTAGQAAKLAIDKDNGGVLSCIRTLTTTDQVTNTPVASLLASTAAYAGSLVVKAAAGRLFSINGYNSKALAQFVQVLNAASLPADTTVPISILTVPATSNFSIDFGPLGIPLSTGIVVSNSSTGPALTHGSADCWFQASYL